MKRISILIVYLIFNLQNLCTCSLLKNALKSLNTIVPSEGLSMLTPVSQIISSPLSLEKLIPLGKCTPPVTIPFGLDSLPMEFKRCLEDLKFIGEGEGHPLVGKTTDEIIKFYGYQVEEYKVITDDGYILTLFRIPPRNLKDSVPILLMHGLGGCSDNWVINGPHQSLAFILADLGFDVWLGNNRGSSFSLEHLYLSYEDDLEYWDFSWHEMGVFDLPAFISFIKLKTGRKMFVVGHSQGCTQIAAGASTWPGNRIVNGDNIVEAFFLAPACHNGKSTNPLRLVIAPLLSAGFGDILYDVFQGRIDTPTKLGILLGRQGINLLGNACAPSAVLCGACQYQIYALFGYDAPLMNYTNIPNLVDKYPNILPFKCIIHHAQNMNSCEFRQFDYGSDERNKKKYGSPVPPSYQLQNINIPTHFFYGDMDNLAGPQDTILTASQFSEQFRKDMIRVDSPYFNHVDFVTAINAKELLYDEIIKRIQLTLSGKNMENKSKHYNWNPFHWNR